MKILLDTANVATITEWVDTGIIDGVTTNPTHFSKEKEDPDKIIDQLCGIFQGGIINVQVTEQDPDLIYKQAQMIAARSEDIIVKVPCHVSYYPVIKRLVAEEIPINVTLVFSLEQALCMCKLGVRYVSPFVGRLDDTGIDGIALVEQIRAMIDRYGFSTQVLAASLRNQERVTQAINAGAHLATLPPAVLVEMVKHRLTDTGIQLFDADWKKVIGRK